MLSLDHDGSTLTFYVNGVQKGAANVEEQETASSLMLKVAQIQRSELVRLVSESETLNRQIMMLSDGRYRLQEALDALREQAIAARVLILQETTSPHSHHHRPVTTLRPLSATP